MIGVLHFVDLFAGLGGFHLALQQLGHKCVFACEIDSDLAALYEKNFGIRPHGDIRRVDINRIPNHDILCAGFPCQPFSKAGGQRGLECPQWGNLIDYVIKILRTRQPKYLIIENVPNLVRHDEGRTWQHIIHRIRLAGYSVSSKVLSPHMFQIPQIRERAFIVGRRGGLRGFEWPEQNLTSEISIKSILDRQPNHAKPLAPKYVRYLDAWQTFLDRFPGDEKLPSFPIWAMEFGATYPFINETPFGAGARKMREYKGSFGVPFKEVNGDQLDLNLPSYARVSDKQFPGWKVAFIKQNREFYLRHQRWIDEWLPLIRDFPPSFQKFEWNCQGEERNIWNLIIQFRASGIRTKRTTSSPSLVAMTTSQVPVITWEKRYMTIRECSRLQSMGGLLFLPKSKSSAFRALGNAVNADLVSRVAGRLMC